MPATRFTVSTKTRTAIWNEMLSISRVVRYYEALSAVYRRNYQCWRALIVVVGASASISPLLVGWNVVQPIAGGFLGVLIAWDFFADSATKAAQLANVRSECGELQVEYKKLWNSLGHVDDYADETSVVTEYERLLNRSVLVGAKATSIGVAENRKLNEICAEEAYIVVSNAYAS